MRLIGLFATIATLVFSCGPPKAAPENEGDLYVSPASQSDERAAKLLPMHGSEDARHLLTYSPQAQPAQAIDSAKQYFANERFDWILHLQPTQPITRQQLRACFDRQWQEQHGEPQLYGRSTKDNRWTYAVAGGADTVFSALALGWKFMTSAPSRHGLLHWPNWRIFGRPPWRALRSCPPASRSSTTNRRKRRCARSSWASLWRPTTRMPSLG